VAEEGVAAGSPPVLAAAGAAVSACPQMRDKRLLKSAILFLSVA